ncbi:MAG: 1-deoxy-D-xylulose-5-phosphate reductoisomerase, partial [Ruminococcus sp.]|nr:1-deoxy-D-xylulose-5-phosphate reductoisomerase [Ruminococcus sp.]
KCLGACKKAIARGGIIPAVANGANEIANKLFREGKISFLNIGELVSEAVNSFEFKKASSLDDVLDADNAAREFVYNSIK